MTAGKVSLHIKRGILKVIPDANCKLLPMADGGEGTVETLVEATHGHIKTVQVHDPLMRPIHAVFGISGDGQTAFIEMAAASGLELLKSGERNPLIATSYGTGELIGYALNNGCSEIILGIGGSATVDGGVGMAQALGISFTDETGWEIKPGGGGLEGICKFDLSNRDPRLALCKIYAACDVTNPLTGENGAARVFGPQKGALQDMVRQLEDNLINLSAAIHHVVGIDVGNLPGGGAAGGMGAGIVAFLGGELRPGVELISRYVKLEEQIAWADLVITGEGKMDYQTAFGKTPAGVVKAANRLNKPVVAFTGMMGSELEDMGFTAIFPIADKPMTIEESIRNAGRLLENSVERSFRMMMLGKGM